ncbi:MAG TPA: hypothetical protein VIY29_01585, partial [Ktedonobacteraceae bacterium]
RQVNIDEIDTHPLRLKSQQVNIDEIDTLPPLPRNGRDDRSRGSTPPPATMALVPASSNLPLLQSGVGHNERGRLALTQQITDPSSWTAGSASGSPYAKRIVEQSTRARRRRRRFFHPIDALRWWLLHPGRLEFILWLGGTMLLLTVTFTLLFVTAISLSWMAPVQSRPVSTSNSADNTLTSTPISVTRGGMTLTLFDTGPIEPGQALHLSGQGFSPHGRIMFTDEKNHPMLKQDSQTNSVQADEHGVFTVTLNNSAWTSGRHNVVVRDVVSGHTLDLPVDIAPGPFGKKATPTPVPGLNATATTTGGPGVFPTAVGATPVSPKPTVGATPPTPTPTRQPSPTPTATPVVTPTATPGITPTAGTTPTSGTNSSSSNRGSNFMPQSAAASIEGSADVPPSSANALSSLGAGTWLLIVGYMLAMCLLGIAGVLRRRHV